MLYVASTFTDPIYVAAHTGVNATGKPTYGTPTRILARVERSQGVSRDGAQGTSDTTSATLFTSVAIGPLDRLWLDSAAIAAVEASLAAPSDTVLAAAAAAAARLPGPNGCEPQKRLGGLVVYYLTRV